MLIYLPMVFSALVTLAGSDGRAAAPTPTAIETRAPAERRAHGEHNHERRDLCTVLSCTAEQRSEIDGLLTRMHERMKALHGARGEEGKALAAAMKDGALDRAEVLAALHESDEAHEKRATILAETIVGVYGALDKGQREVLGKLVAERGAKVVLGGKHGGGHRGKLDKGGGKAKPGKAKPGKQAKASKLERRAARFSRVKAPVAKVGIKSRS